MKAAKCRGDTSHYLEKRRPREGSAATAGPCVILLPFESKRGAMDSAPLEPGRKRWIGQALRRLEDDRLLRGQGQFTDDISMPGQAHACFVRSPHPHARIRSISCDAARAMPGVLAVFTGADARSDGLQPMPFMRLHTRPDGSPIVAAPRMALTHDVTRFVGDAVAIVIAESRN